MSIPSEFIPIHRHDVDDIIKYLEDLKNKMQDRHLNELLKRLKDITHK